MAFWDFLKGQKVKQGAAVSTVKTRTRLPSTSPQRDIPITSVTAWDSVSRVRQALFSLEAGIFTEASLLCEGMLRDDRIAGLLEQRLSSLLGSAVSFGDESEEDETNATECEAREWFEKQWPKILPLSAGKDLLKWGLLLGVGVGEVVWDKGEKWTPSLRIWHPRNLRWDWSTRTYWISTMDGQEQIVPGDGRWVLFTPSGAQRGWINGLVRSLAIPFLIRQFTYRDWARFSEVYGIPTRVGKLPAEASDEDKRRFVKELASLSTESTILAPQIGDKGFSVELIEATATGWMAFQGLIEKTEDSISIILLGQTLTSSAKSGGLGTGGVAQVHERVRTDLLQSDSRNFGQCLKEQMLSFAAAYNWGDAELAPTPCWEVEPPDDLGAEATQLNTLAMALQAFDAIGVPFDVCEIAERFDLPLREDVDPHEVMDEKRAATIVGAKQAQKPPEQVAQPKGAGPGSPSPSRAPLSVGSLSMTKPPEIVAGQIYTDAVADSGVEHAAKAVAPVLQTLLAIIERAETYGDIRAAILKAYPEMSAADLSALVYKAVILANLNGRDSVVNSNSEIANAEPEKA